MGQIRVPFDIRQRLAASADPEDLVLGPIEAGRRYVVQWVSVEDETTNFTSFRILKTTPGHEHFYMEELSPIAGRLYWNDTPIFLQELETLIVRFTGATANDVINAYFSGWYTSTRSRHLEDA